MGIGGMGLGFGLGQSFTRGVGQYQTFVKLGYLAARLVQRPTYSVIVAIELVCKF